MNRIRHFFSSNLNNRGIALLALLSLFGLRTMLAPKKQTAASLRRCEKPALLEHQVVCDGIGQKSPSLFLLFDQKININEANARELALVPKMRKNVAQAIVEERETLGRFSNYDQISEVKGVGPKTLEQLKKFTSLN